MYIPIYISDPARYMDAGFTHIEVQRDLGDGYAAITASTAEAPTVTGTRTEFFALNDMELVLRVDDGWHTVEFAGADPYNLASVIADISIPDLTASGVAGALSLTHDIADIGSILEIGSGDANDSLGFTAETYYGKGPHIALSSDNHYFLTDPIGDTDSTYRYRFTDGTVYTDWNVMTTDDGWDVSGSICLCYIRAADTDYTVLEEAVVKVSIVRTTDTVSVGGKYLAGGSATFTISDGYGHIFLPQGQVFDIAVDGTGIVRRITVPDEDTVDLLDSSISEGDLFEVQTLDIPSAIRRT